MLIPLLPIDMTKELNNKVVLDFCAEILRNKSEVGDIKEAYGALYRSLFPSLGEGMRSVSISAIMLALYARIFEITALWVQSRLVMIIRRGAVIYGGELTVDFLESILRRRSIILSAAAFFLSFAFVFPVVLSIVGDPKFMSVFGLAYEISSYFNLLSGNWYYDIFLGVVLFTPGLYFYMLGAVGLSGVRIFWSRMGILFRIASRAWGFAEARRHMGRRAYRIGRFWSTVVDLRGTSASARFRYDTSKNP
jgi:hypothetical protein